jgi:NADH:ubiquinone oxidoreductase subunit F (NADH-binding)
MSVSAARLLSALPPKGALGLHDHLLRLGQIDPEALSYELIGEVQRSGLRGRGGGAFSVAEKLEAVAAASRPVVVVNGTEGEPASKKDKLLLKANPHLVLDGAVAAALAVGSREVIVCVEQADPVAGERISHAIEERLRAGTDLVELSVVRTPAGYVCGEETALVNYLNGGPPKPTFKPPLPFERGVDGKPTLIQNVETLAHLGLITRFGADWFRELGTPQDPGTFLVTISGCISRPGVFEIAGGTTLGRLAEAAGGWIEQPLALLVGGYGGTWFRGEDAATLRLGAAALQNTGGNLGPGVVIGLPAGICGVAETARIAEYLSAESAGQCGPCVHGLAAIADGLVQISDGVGGPGELQTINRWCSEIFGRGACRHPDGTARLIFSAMDVFAADFHSHQQGQPCRTDLALRDLLPIPGPGVPRPTGARR